MAQPITMEKEQDFHSKSLWVSMSLPCIWEVLTYYNFYLMCMCVHVCIWACIYVWICVYIQTWGSQRTAMNIIPREMSHGVFQLPGAWQGKLASQETLGVPLPPTSHYWDCRHTNILYVFWASNSGPYFFTRLATNWQPTSLVLHFLLYI